MLFVQNTAEQYPFEQFYQLQQLQHQQEQQQQQQQQQLQQQRPQRPQQQQQTQTHTTSIVDFDDDQRSLSLSSSPNSTVQYSPGASGAFSVSPPASFRGVPAIAGVPRGAESLGLDPEFSMSRDFEASPMLSTADMMMQPDSWLSHSNAQLGLGRSLGRIAHHRDSSLSSLGSTSAGPASPFSQNTSNPHIAVTDPSGDGYGSMPPYYEDASSYAVKPLAASASPAADSQDTTNFFGNHAAYTSPDTLPVSSSAAAYGSLLSNGARQRNGGVSSSSNSNDRSGLLPPPDLTVGSNRSQPVSVASSIAGDSPATPSLDQHDEEARRRNGENASPDTAHSGGSEKGEQEIGGGVGAPGSLGSPGSPGTPGVLLEPDLEPDFPFPLCFDEDDCSLFLDDTAFQQQPKLDRTMTDVVYSDEMYSPNFPVASSAAPSQSQSQSQMTSSPSQDMFAQRLQAINNQHLSAAAAHSSPASSGGSRGRSPFRNDSSLAPTPNQEFGHFNSAMSQQQQQQQQQQQSQRQQHQQHQIQAQVQQVQHHEQQSQRPGSQQTISPKDAMLEYREPMANDGDAANFSLFGQANNSQSFQPFTDPTTAAAAAAATAVPAGPAFNYMQQQLAQPMPQQLQIPQQYPFISHHQQPNASIGGGNTATSRQSPISSVRSGGMNAAGVATSRPSPSLVSTVPDPRRALAIPDGGTYTCTYHGCKLRFETPALLQKHKREGHRQINTLAARKADSALAMSLITSQAGPHRCERINPSTGKPCNTVFSRPYDLTRHEDTIHNARKQKVRCNLCTEEKTFSRADALTRHFRVCHPEVDFPSKHRKRGQHNAA